MISVKICLNINVITEQEKNLYTHTYHQSATPVIVNSKIFTSTRIKVLKKLLRLTSALKTIKKDESKFKNWKTTVYV